MTKKRVLIIEDESSYAKMVGMRLESEGYHVTLAPDPLAGMMGILKGCPDLVILDLMMVAGGGYGILERMRWIPSKTRIPIVILTARTVDEELQERLRNYNIAAIFQKPYSTDLFLSKVRSLISDSGPQMELNSIGGILNGKEEDTDCRG